MPFDLTDTAILQRLAHQRWGPTGFSCRVCRHPHGRRLRSRPRVRVCALAGCRAQTSITANTVLHRTKVPLVAWVLRGEMLEGYEACEIPTSTEAAELFGIARSTAWAINQKVAASVEIYQRGFHAPYLHAAVAMLPLRPARSTYLGHLRDVVERLAGSRHANVALTLTRWSVALARVAVPHDQRIRFNRQHAFSTPQHHPGIAAWLRNHLLGRHGPVSLRWLPRWIDAFLWIYNHLHDPMQRVSPSWWQLAVAAGPQPLPRLDPWRDEPSLADPNLHEPCPMEPATLPGDPETLPGEVTAPDR
jgi:hypothetical protein